MENNDGKGIEWKWSFIWNEVLFLLEAKPVVYIFTSRPYAGEFFYF